MGLMRYQSEVVGLVDFLYRVVKLPLMVPTKRGAGLVGLMNYGYWMFRAPLLALQYGSNLGRT